VTRGVAGLLVLAVVVERLALPGVLLAAVVAGDHAERRLRRWGIRGRPERRPFLSARAGAGTPAVVLVGDEWVQRSSRGADEDWREGASLRALEGRGRLISARERPESKQGGGGRDSQALSHDVPSFALPPRADGTSDGHPRIRTVASNRRASSESSAAEA